MGILVQGLAHMLPSLFLKTLPPYNPHTPSPGFVFNLWAIIYTLH